MIVRTNDFRVLVVMAALTLAAGLLALAAAGKSAKATLPGTNGSVAFISDRDGNDEIYVMNADGSNPTRLTTDPIPEQWPALSPDGTKVAFQSWPSDPAFLTGSEIYTMDVEDNNRDGNGDHRTQLTNNSIQDFKPDWSPDGSKIAFYSLRRNDLLGFNDYDIFVMDPRDNTGPLGVPDGEGDNLRRLTNSRRFDGLPAWSPDGSKIAFVSGRSDDVNTNPELDGEIYVMDVEDNNKDGNGDNLTRLTNNSVDDAAKIPGRCICNDGLWSQLSWSPDGEKIAFQRWEGDGSIDIYTMDAKDDTGPLGVPDGNGDNLTNLTKDGPLNYRYPAWSPDGKKIAFWSGSGNGLGKDAEIYSVDLTYDINTGAITGTSNPINLTNNNAGDIQPDWVPDKTAPTTTATLSPKPNEHGWNNSDVTVSLSAEDRGEPSVEKITYSASGAENITQTDVSGSTVEIPLDQEGTTTLTYFATDNAGNVEAPKTLIVRIDKTPPTVLSTSPPNNATGVEATANISATFTEIGSGMDASTLTTDTFKVVQVKPTGDVPVSGTVSYASSTATFDPDSSLDKGLYRATLTTDIKDNAGNALSGNSLSGNYTWLFATAGPSQK